MRLSASIGVAVAVAALFVSFAAAEVTIARPGSSRTPRPAATAAPAAVAPTALPTRPPTPSAAPTPEPTVEGYVGTFEITASLPALKDGAQGPPEAQALLGRLKDKATLTTRISLVKDVSRQEVVSTDFLLPAGTVILHEAGAKFYVIADPQTKTYTVMDAAAILGALEGGIGIANSEYRATVQHTAEKKVIGDFTCRKSVLTVNYASAIPFESDVVYVQQTNTIVIWHTPELISSALLDHFFFKFQRDKTATVQKVVAAELGFPMEMTMTVSQPGAKSATSAGTIEMKVSGLKRDKKLEASLFELPPAGYKKVERNPYFRNAAVTP